jgi:hypothetical protein
MCFVANPRMRCFDDMARLLQILLQRCKHYPLLLHVCRCLFHGFVATSGDLLHTHIFLLRWCFQNAIMFFNVLILWEIHDMCHHEVIYKLGRKSTNATRI